MKTKMSTESNEGQSETPEPRRPVVKYTTSGKPLQDIVQDLISLLSSGFEVEFYLEPESTTNPNPHLPYHPHQPWNPGISTPRTPMPMTPYVTFNDNTAETKVNHGFIDTPINRIAGAGL